MNLMFWALMVSMLLIAIILLVYPLLKVRQKSALAYKESNLKINDEKIKELDLDLHLICRKAVSSSIFIKRHVTNSTENC